MTEVQKRGFKQAALTRLFSKLSIMKAKDNKEDAKSLLDPLQEAYEAFEDAHEVVYQSTTDYDALMKEEQHFIEIGHQYTQCLNDIMPWLKDSPAKQSTDSCSHNLGKLLTLPKIDIQPFSGDCMTYSTFMSVFKRCVASVLDDDEDKLIHLKRLTTSHAADAILWCNGPSGYEKALSILQDRFGNKHLIASKIKANLCSSKTVRTPLELRKLADDAANAAYVLTEASLYSELDTQHIISTVVQRIDTPYRLRWRSKAVKYRTDNDEYPKFSVFIAFLNSIAEELNDPVYGAQSDMCYAKPNKAINSSAVNARDYSKSHCDKSTSGNDRKCLMCQSTHPLYACSIFRKKPADNRIEFVSQNNLCRKCFSKDHSTTACTSKVCCKKCGGVDHSTFVHLDDSKDSTRMPNNSKSSTCNAVTNDIVGDECISMPTVNVVVNNAYNTHALLDSGSTNSFITADAVNSLALNGNTISYQLSTVNAKSITTNTKVVNFTLYSLDGTESLSMSNVFVVEEIPFAYSHCRDLSGYSHLSDVPLASVRPPTKVELLIGQDNSEAFVPLRVLKGQPGDPFAVLTKFGWCLNGVFPGVSPDCVSLSVVSNFISTSIDAKVEALWDIADEHVGSAQKAWSITDRKVVDLWQRESKLVNGHVEVPIPWKVSDVDNNLTVALSRHKSLLNSVCKKSILSDYDDAVKSMISKGFAEEIPVDEVQNDNPMTWYLPHHPVFKRSGEIRIVFDCASRFRGYSLNDCAFRGPNLNNKLSNVLLRFRQHEVAMSADISAMYNQVLLPHRDRDALRFLWNVNGNVVHHRMLVHPFGGVWCSSAATYALHECTKSTQDVVIQDIILNSFYVDDCLLSAKAPEEMSDVIARLKSVLSSRGFDLTKFVVNDTSVFSLIPVCDRSQDDDTVFSSDSQFVSKALGVSWNVSLDSFLYSVDVDASKLSYTKAEMLSVVASIFDPLGFVSPVTITGMMLFQEANKLKVKWKQQLPDHLVKQWLSWLKTLSSLATIRVPRCVKPSMFDSGYSELHVFCDASQKAYACCFYLRSVNIHGQIHVSLVCGKSRLAPIKPMSIPRLELQAAYMAANMEIVVREQLSELSLCPTTFWSDSQIVIAYIRNTTRRFHVFVANRVCSIQRSSNVDQWKHIAGKDNPADMLTRGIVVSQLSDMWFTGPSFLSCHKNEWQVDSVLCDIPVADPEVKKSLVAHPIALEKLHPVDALVHYFSDWHRLLRATAWLMKVQDKFRKKHVPDDQSELSHISSLDISNAEVVIISHVQHLFYSDELVKLSSGESVLRSSTLSNLLPRIIDSGLLVVSGRLKHSSLSLRHREPYIIPYDSPVAILIVRHYHNSGHHGVEWTLNNMRCKFWITRGRVLVKRVKRSCVPCRRMFATACSQQMADLPPERLIVGKPPFSVTGCDCFGPFSVSYRRGIIPRYGCVFTCMSTRAIHVEKLDTLEADSFLNAFRRFVARRGSPDVMMSDNATNFTASSKLLEMAHDEVVQSYCSKSLIEWKFIPPRASHFGGAWERMIGTIRRVLTVLLEGCGRLSDEVLVTLFCEVESMINGRPLTKVSDDPTDPAALTPNHLLLLRGNPNFSLGVAKPDDMYRGRWRHIQSLASRFWVRWTKEYLPQLQKRSKWLMKSRNISVGDLVLMLDENTPRSVWPLGLVISTNVGRDGLIRSVRLKTKSSEFVRPITKLVFLEAFGQDAV